MTLLPSGVEFLGERRISRADVAIESGEGFVILVREHAVPNYRGVPHAMEVSIHRGKDQTWLK